MRSVFSQQYIAGCRLRGVLRLSGGERMSVTSSEIGSAQNATVSLSVVLGSFALFLGLALAVWAAPQGRFVLVLTDPSAGAAESLSVIGNAGGAFVEAGRLPWMSIAYSESEDFAARLMEAGAWIVLNHSLAVGCLRGN